MMWALRDSFPLHFHIFKQTACHLPHEANVEQVFSRAGNLSDPNMDPEFLAHLVMVLRSRQQEGVQTDARRNQGQVLRALPRQGQGRTRG